MEVNEGTPERPSEADRDYYTRVMDEAKAERDHQARMAQIQAKKEVDLVNAKKESWEQRAWKRNLTIGILVGVFLIVVVSAFWYGSLRIHESDRTKFEKQTELQTETAQKCIEEGNIWLDDDCLLAKKG